jgi:hypothetical protein
MQQSADEVPHLMIRPLISKTNRKLKIMLLLENSHAMPLWSAIMQERSQNQLMSGNVPRQLLEIDAVVDDSVGLRIYYP